MAIMAPLLVPPTTTRSFRPPVCSSSALQPPVKETAFKRPPLRARPLITFCIFVTEMVLSPADVAHHIEAHKERVKREEEERIRHEATLLATDQDLEIVIDIYFIEAQAKQGQQHVKVHIPKLEK